MAQIYNIANYNHLASRSLGSTFDGIQRIKCIAFQRPLEKGHCLEGKMLQKLLIADSSKQICLPSLPAFSTRANSKQQAFI